jgi:hypothetical protein
MFLFSWLRNRNSNPRAKRTTAARPKHARFRPLLEALEDRAVPAVLHVTTTLDVVDPNDGLLSLREAVMQTNGSQAPVTIEVPAGTYALLHGELLVTGANIKIEGAGAGATIIDGGGASSDFFLDPFTPTFSGVIGVMLSGLTIQGGRSGSGGGILSYGADLTIDHCTISGNSAQNQGGGILNGSGTITILDSTIQGNDFSGGFYGGGIENDDTMTIRNSVVAGNSAESGGGIFNAGTLTVSNSVVSGNSALEGGGIANLEGPFATLRVQSCTFLGNAAARGGAIVNGPGSTLTVTNSSFSGNTATTDPNSFSGEGGAIANFGTLDVRGSTFSANTASDSGAGIYNGGFATLQQCTLSGNTAGSEGGGIFNPEFATLAVKDSTVLNNLAPAGADIYNLGALTLDDSTVGVMGP